MESNPAVSVIVPLYNAEKYIAECLDSLLAQTFQNFEVIVVDDCSTDNSRQIAESYLEKFGGRLKIFDNEKNSGAGGTRSLGDFISANADFAIVGEPTRMRATIAESGLLVIDGCAHGRSAHAARAGEGINAIYKAMEDIQKLKTFRFDKLSPTLGEVKLSVTQINAGTAHNVIPDSCSFVVDIRPNECYSNAEILEMLQKEVSSNLVARNLTNRSSATPASSPLYKTALKLGMEMITSPTSSDWMRLPIEAIKIGPGDSNRSHKADEYILKSEICEGIETYINYIDKLEL